jgi:hypothetical protein
MGTLVHRKVEYDMLTSASASRGGAACAAMAATAIVMFSGWSAPSDGGIDIPGIGHDDSVKCAASSSDPNARSSCNQRGHNGTDGRDGAVHRDGGDDSGSSTRS